MLCDSTKNICFIAGTLGQGGAERQLFYYVKSLKENGDHPYVLCLTKGDFWEKQILDLGVPVIWVGKSNSQICRLFSIIKQISQRPTDIIHSQHFHTNLYGYLAGLTLRKKVLGSLRGNVYSEIASIGFLGKISFYCLKMLTVNSKSGLANALQLNKSKNQIFYLPNLVDENYFFPMPSQNIDNKLRVIYMGTLWPLKRVDRIIRVADKCHKQGLDIEFRLYGDGVQKQELIDQAIMMGVYNINLQFMGSIAESRVAYQQADVLLLTSSHEGTPNVVLEAMACGLPVISTRVGDVPDLITDGINGYIIDFDDDEALFCRLKELYFNPSLRLTMGKANREKIVSERSFQNLNQILEYLYDQIL